ncbi:MAG TPA: sugar transferase [Ktedonobacterales bacterium]
MDHLKQQHFAEGTPSIPSLPALPHLDSTWPPNTLLGAAILPAPRVRARLARTGRRAAIRAALVALDAVMICIAFIAAYYMRYVVLNGVRFTTPFLEENLSSFEELQIVVTLGMLLAFGLKGLYSMRTAGNWFKVFWTIAAATTMAFAIFSAYDYVVRKTDIAIDARSRSLVIFAWLLIIVFVSVERLMVSLGVTMLYRRGIGLTNLLVVGSGRIAKLIMQQVAATHNLGYRVAGFLHDQEGSPGDFGRFKVLGGLADLEDVIHRENIGEVMVALPSQHREQILRALAICDRAGADAKLVPDFHDLSLARFDIDTVEGIPLFGLKTYLTSTWRYRVKRVVDVLGASLMLLIGAPFWLLIALAIKLDSPGPVLYRQQRVGHRGKRFDCLKFRSMRADADEMLHLVRELSPADERGKFKLRDDPRCTLVGRYLRRFSLDEIPQILCVLRGEMSLVGPRPPLVAEYERYEDWEKGRMDMPPGMTGLWQVRGRSDIDFDEMVLMDLYYIENWSLRLDFQILLRTLPAVLASRGAY